MPKTSNYKWKNKFSLPINFSLSLLLFFFHLRCDFSFSSFAFCLFLWPIAPLDPCAVEQLRQDVVPPPRDVAPLVVSRAALLRDVIFQRFRGACVQFLLVLIFFPVQSFLLFLFFFFLPSLSFFLLVDALFQPAS